MVYKCLHGQAPDYFSELCMPVAQVAERQHLRTASRNSIVAPRFQLDTMVVVPLPWLCQQLGTHCRTNYEIRTSTVPPSDADVSVSTIPGALSTLEALCDYALYKSTFTLHYITICFCLCLFRFLRLVHMSYRWTHRHQTRSSLSELCTKEYSNTLWGLEYRNILTPFGGYSIQF